MGAGERLEARRLVVLHRRVDRTEFEHRHFADDRPEDGNELVLHRRGVTLEGKGHAAPDVVEAGVVGMRLLEATRTGRSVSWSARPPVGQLDTAGTMSRNAG